MNIYAISGFINGISAVIFGSIVYLKNPKELTNKIFGLMSVVFVVWSFSYGFWQLTANYETALFWVRMLSVGSTFIPIFFIHWVFALFNIQEEKRKVIIFGYVLTLVFISFIFSPLYIKGIVPQLNFPWWPQAGVVYTLYIIVGYLGLIGYGFYSLIKLYKKNKDREDLQDQIKYILLAIVVGFVGGATNFPLWYGLAVPPYGNFVVFLYPFILAYIMLKHRLMDIKLILTQFLVGAISVLLFIQFLASSNIVDYFWRAIFLVVFLVFGYFLIKSVLKEVKRRYEIQELYQEVDKLNKAKSEFLSIASHQLRTPLAINKGYISMMLEGVYGKVNNKLKRSIENIYESNERLIGIVNDLLNLSRLDSGKTKFEPTNTSLEVLLDNVISEVKDVIKDKGLYIKVEKLDKPLPKLKIDQIYIRQVVLNLLDNAIKYTREGGITVTLSKFNNTVQIKISDTGEGVSKEEMDSLFQVFSRATAGIQFHTEGTGMGLYIAEKFIKMHNGKIYVESEGKGRGSTFYIELPIK